jgi:hypothetical protein
MQQRQCCPRTGGWYEIITPHEGRASASLHTAVVRLAHQQDTEKAKVEGRTRSLAAPVSAIDPGMVPLADVSQTEQTVQGGSPIITPTYSHQCRSGRVSRSVALTLSHDFSASWSGAIRSHTRFMIWIGAVTAALDILEDGQSADRLAECYGM